MARGQYKYKVTLTENEQSELEGMIKRGKSPAYRIKHAQILLNADTNGPNLADRQIAEFIRCHQNTVLAVRQRFVEQGIEAALERKKRSAPPIARKLDGVGVAQLFRIACSQPPNGRSRWTLQLLCDKLVELQVVESICPATVHTYFKKNSLKPHLRQCWVIPPENSAEFVANMEDVLDVYQRPLDENRPLVCMDEQPVQLVKETRIPIPSAPGQPARYDYEYERNGTANHFMFCSPLIGWRRVSIRERKTASDAC